MDEMEEPKAIRKCAIILDIVRVSEGAAIRTSYKAIRASCRLKDGDGAGCPRIARGRGCLARQIDSIVDDEKVVIGWINAVAGQRVILNGHRNYQAGAGEAGLCGGRLHGTAAGQGQEQQGAERRPN